MPGIEFVDAGGDAEADDVLETPPRRPWPRWVWAVAGLLVVAVTVTAVTAGRSTDGTPQAAPSPSPFDSIAPGPTNDGAIPQIVALTADGTSLFWVTGRRLYRAGPVGRAAASVAITPTGGDFAELQLVPDPTTRTIWVVSHGSTDSSGGAGNVEGFSTEDLTPLSRVSARSLITGAAALGGSLYVLAAGRLQRIAPHGRAFVSVAPVDSSARGLLTVGRSLLFVEADDASAVGRWTPDGGVQQPVALGTTDSALAVVGSTVFLVGTRAGRAVLDTLTPAGLVAHRGPDTGLTQLQIVASGRQSVILLGSDARGLQLACVTADASHRPSVRALLTASSANVAVLRGTVFQAVGSTVAPVTFPTGGCPA